MLDYLNLALLLLVLVLQARQGREIRLLRGERAAPETFKMTLDGKTRTMTLPEAVQYWKFERAKHAVGSAKWNAYNQRLHEVGASGD